MAVKLINNILESENIKTIDISDVTVEKVIREYSDGDAYDSSLVECYNADTGETFYKTVEDSSLSVIAIVNKKSATLDYIIKEDDEVLIMILPASDLTDEDGKNASNGSLIGLVAGFALTIATLNPVTIVVGMIIGVVGGTLVGLFWRGISDKLGLDSQKKVDKKDKQKLPDVRNAENQILLNNPFPFVIGKHLVTPQIIGSPYNEISGNRGQNNYIHILYDAGYTPLRITDIKLGDDFLAHNQAWAGNVSLQNVFHGKLSGLDNWGINKEYADRSKVDLTNRPQVPASTMNAHDWEVEAGTYCTIYSQTYANQAQTRAVLVTPIITDKIILTPTQLKENANVILGHWEGPYPELQYQIELARFEGEDCIQQAEDYAVALQESQERYYSNPHGDIDPIWKNNGVSIEILQQSQNPSVAVDYGTIYPATKVQNAIGVKTMHIIDESLNENDLVDYKGLSLTNGLRNNPVKFTGQCPLSLNVELNFNDGLYKTRSEQVNNVSEVKYARIPMWIAIQWRVYSEDNAASDPAVAGEETTVPEYDYNAKRYKSNVRGWHGFSGPINNAVGPSTFTESERQSDIAAHTGNSISPTSSVNLGWVGAKAYNLESLGGTNGDQAGLNEIRCVAVEELKTWAYYSLLTDAERALEGSAPEQFAVIFTEKFLAYFMDYTNTTKSIEVRVIRLSPNYINEVQSTKEHGTYTFNDDFTWEYLSYTTYDEEKATKDKVIETRKPLKENDLRKHCIIALKAKADKQGTLANNIKKLSCIAQAFAPYYDDTTKKWVPENVNLITNYYDENGNKLGPTQTKTAKEQYEEKRQAGLKAVKKLGGNDYVSGLVGRIRTQANYDKDKGRYYIPKDSALLKHCTSNVASSFLLACIGAHMGVDAMGYKQSEFNGVLGDFNMNSFTEWYKNTLAVKDGSTFPTAGYHYNQNGEYVRHNAGDEVEIQFCANGYVYQKETLENVLAKIAVAGRAVFSKDSQGRIFVVMDKLDKYPVALINQQNTISTSCTIVYKEQPSGLQISYTDENDGYEKNIMYCMSDNEDENNPKGDVEPYSFPFVTNNLQAWSLGRYFLAGKILGREVVKKKIGMEGFSVALGDLVVVQDDNMLIGTDNGGRITELIEGTENGVAKIYGFLINNVYEYTGGTDSQNNPEQGVIIMQPGVYGETRILTVGLAKTPKKQSSYTLSYGKTNLVLFDTPLTKGEGFCPAVDNIVGFGKLKKIASLYRVSGIKVDAKRNYELTLIKYQDELYQYGKALPSFQSNITPPANKGNDLFVTKDTPSGKDIRTQIIESQKSVETKINEIETGTANVDMPAPPKNFTVVAQKDGIYMAWEHYSYARGLSDVIKHYLITSTNFSQQVSDTKYLYNFNRNTDGYPEREELSTKKFTIIAVNNYGKNSISESAAVNVTSYGTWQPVVPTLTKSVNQGGISFSWTAPTGANSRTLYGTNRYELTIKYDNAVRKVIKTNDTNAVYNFDRDSAKDGYPEVTADANHKGLDKYSFILKVINESGKTATSTAQTFSSSELAGYGTWQPLSVAFVKKTPSKDKIDVSWNAPTASRTLYGVNSYRLTVYYNDVQKAEISTPDLRAVYNFVRDVDGYPEKVHDDTHRGLDKYKFTLRATNQSGNYVDCTETFRSGETDDYGTWIPATPTFVKRSAKEYGIEYEWKGAESSIAGKELYGSNSYVLRVSCGNTLRTTIQKTNLTAIYNFDRTDDGYPEKQGVTGSLHTLNEFTATVEVINESTNSKTSASITPTDEEYLGWKPDVPSVTTRSSGRACTVNPVNPELRFGEIRYKIVVNQPDKDGNVYYKPTPTANYLESEENYRDLNQQDVPYITDSPYTQSMPLIGQSATAYKLYTWHGESNEDEYDTGKQKALTYSATDPSAGNSPIVRTMDIDSVPTEVKYWYDLTNKVHYASLLVSMPNPQDTTYRFKIKAFNSVANIESVYADPVAVTAKATSAYDVVMGAITTNSLAPDAVTTDKIAAGTITAEKIFVKALAAISANLGQITDGSLVGNQNNYWYLSDEYNGNVLVHRAGDFQVGTTGSDYIRCTTQDGTNYNIAIHASKFEITAIGTVVRGEFFVSPNDAVIDANGVPSSYYAKISSNGVVINVPASAYDLHLSKNLIINAQNAQGNFDQGIRINQGSDGYSTLLIGSDANTDIGSANGFWFGVNRSTRGNKLYLNFNNFTAETYFAPDGDSGAVKWTGNVDGVATHSKQLDITGFGVNGFTFNQTYEAFLGNTGWCHYLIANHGDGANYYNFVIGLPFWGVPMYRRQMGDTSNVSGWHSFITAENIGSQSVSNADTVDGYHASDLLKKGGDTLTGIISKASGGTSISARDNVLIKQTKQTQYVGASFNPVIGVKTWGGHWSLGTLGSESLLLSYDTDADYSAGYNMCYPIYFPTAGKEGTLALTSDTVANADALNGYSSDTSASANTIARRDANGYINAVIFHDSWGADDINRYLNPTIMFKGNSDGYLRNTSIADLLVALGLNNVDNTRDANKSVSYAGNAGKLSNYEIKTQIVTGYDGLRTFIPVIDSMYVGTEGGYVYFINGVLIQWGKSKVSDTDIQNEHFWISYNGNTNPVVLLNPARTENDGVPEGDMRVRSFNYELYDKTYCTGFKYQITNSATYTTNSQAHWVAFGILTQ